MDIILPHSRGEAMYHSRSVVFRTACELPLPRFYVGRLYIQRRGYAYSKRGEKVCTERTGNRAEGGKGGP